MALVIEQRFPLGRFHATRWNQNPFEDAYGEWPPSPWRLLRALAARWFQYARETGDGDVQRRDNLLQALASSLPAFALPQLTWRGPALKQYHPTEVTWTDAAKKAGAYRAPQRTLIEDHYRALPANEPIIWSWEQLHLPGDQLKVLDQLLERTLYFGRAESFCRLGRLPALPEGVHPNTVLTERDTGGMVPVLVPLSGTVLDVGVLLASTDSAGLKGRPTPPGTAWYYAVFPQQPPIRRPPRGGTRFPAHLTCVQFAMGGCVYPPLRRWIKVAERFRGQVLTQMSRQLTGEPRAHYGVLIPEQREALALISGKDSAGHPLCGHRHAFFLIWPDANGLPTRLIVWRRQPFTSAELQALMAAAQRPIAWENGAPDWSLRLVPLPFETPPPSGLLAEARVWESATPFVPPAGRHRFRRNGRARPHESPERLLVRLLQLEGRPLPERVTLLEECEEAPWIYLHETRQRRQLREESHTPWVRPGYRLWVTFQEPVRGPLILGDSAHFGLGLFVAAEP